MKKLIQVFCLFMIPVLTGCGYTIREQYNYRYNQDSYNHPVKPGEVQNGLDLDKSTEDIILALDPENISEDQVRDILSLAPAPRIINFHGGTSSAYKVMESLSGFFVSMGYPENRVRNPADGTFSYSCLRDVKEIIGIIAWYYEREGMRPIIIGHSLRPRHQRCCRHRGLILPLPPEHHTDELHIVLNSSWPYPPSPG
jgi:hypothetical protein